MEKIDSLKADYKHLADKIRNFLIGRVKESDNDEISLIKYWKKSI